MSEAVEVMSPGAAAARLGMSGAALRRAAVAYGEVFGQLPEGSQGRLWPVAAVQRLSDARALIDAGRARSVKGALEALRDGAERPVEAVERRDREVEVAERHLAALRALQLEVSELRGVVLELRSEVSELKALPPVEGAASGERSASSDSEIFHGYSVRAGDHYLEPSGGALVRLARRLERLLGRRGAG